MELGVQLSQQCAFLAFTKPCAQSPALCKSGLVVHTTCNCSTLGRQEDQKYKTIPWLCSQLKASLGQMYEEPFSQKIIVVLQRWLSGDACLLLLRIEFSSSTHTWLQMPGAPVLGFQHYSGLHGLLYVLDSNQPVNIIHINNTSFKRIKVIQNMLSVPQYCRIQIIWFSSK